MRQEFLLVPCGGTTLIGTAMRKAVLRIIEQVSTVRILDLAPFLAGLDFQGDLLENIPSSRRIAVSGCSECCTYLALTRRGIEIGHRLSMNTGLSGNAAIDDMVNRLLEIMES